MSTCARCGASFTCAMADQTGKDCWCASLPPLLPVPDKHSPAACWCPDCLRAELAQQNKAPPSA